jgi:hypothetical protein
VSRRPTELVIGVASAVIGGAILSWLTSLTPIEVIGIALGFLLAYALTLYVGNAIVRQIKRRYQTFMARIVADAKEQVLAQFAAELPAKPKQPNRDAILRAVRASAHGRHPFHEVLTSARRRCVAEANVLPILPNPGVGGR